MQAENRREKNELPIPPVKAPDKREYDIDILVVGSGYSGLTAAITAKKEGADVLVVDKGNVAYSGASPWAQCFQFFNKDFGDDAEMQIEYAMKAGEYLANLDWYKVFLEESYDSFKEIQEWKIFDPFPKASECEPDYYATGDMFEYHQRFLKHDRRRAWRKLLKDNKIPYLNNTMITNVIVSEGKTCGAMGFDVPSGTVMIFHAKAVILATGCGIYRNSGYPMAGNGFDGEYICYKLGLPIVGREFEWHSATNSVNPGAGWNTYSWGWLENLHATAGMSQFGTTVEQQVVKSQKQIGMVGKLHHLKKGVKPLSGPDELGFVPLANASKSTDPDNDPRKGNNVDEMPKRDILGAAVGLGAWKNSGVFCGLDDREGFTGIPGLYVSGDAYGSMIFGAVYTPGQGGSLAVGHIQGKRTAKAAVAYAKCTENARISEEDIKNTEEAILAPMKRETGLDPRWARDVLHSALAPYWVSLAKEESGMKAALLTVEHLRDEVMPIMMAKDPHELRLVHEMRAKICDAEIKLRLGLERKESRGTHYRVDYPFRDDKNFLCYLTAKQGVDGNMQIEKIQLKKEWTGNLQEEYTKRYLVRYPGEEKALGLEEASEKKEG